MCLHVLTGLIYKVSNITPVDFANEYLFKPLSIVNHKHYLAKTKEEHKVCTLSKTLNIFDRVDFI